ncbi:MAG: hypothetical protein JAY60_15680 [Candidatus Thiodiazotropha weberae]|nr:hypothetical protein [Candidatus Thiodiazotropha weberae]MCG7914514.1 hypothetical protein [Candidatus Thiodiazotropha weberae]
MDRYIASTLLICGLIADAQGAPLEWDWLDELGPPAQSSLTVNFGADDADGWSRQFDLSLAGPLYSRFDFFYGESYIESDQAQLETDYYSLGVTTDPLAEIAVSAGFEEWGDDEALTIETLWLGFTMNLGDFSVTLMPQQRDIRLQVTEWYRRRADHVDLESRDIGLMLDYYAADGWLFHGSYFNYDYSKNISRLDEDYRVVYIFPLDTLDLASGLDDYRYSIGIGKLLGEMNIDLAWSRGRSAVDGNYASLTSLSLDIPLNDQFSFNLMGGIQDVDYAEEKILFSNIGLSLFW